MRFDILTIFPEIFKSFLSQALIARAIKKRIISLATHNLRKWTKDSHRTVDDHPYGGGPGMVLMVEPIDRALKELKKKTNHPRVVLFSAKGKKFDQKAAKRLSKCKQIIFICGRYEGVDERVASYLADEEISIGDYVLFGGEVPAMVVIEAVTRLLPGAIGKQASLNEESFSLKSKVGRVGLQDMVEYPHYTRPEVYKIKGRVARVPKILLSGRHKEIEEWRRKNSHLATLKRRKF